MGLTPEKIQSKKYREKKNQNRIRMFPVCRILSVEAKIINGLLLFFDFTKAFDWVHRSEMEEMLTYGMK